MFLRQAALVNHKVLQNTVILKGNPTFYIFFWNFEEINFKASVFRCFSLLFRYVVMYTTHSKWTHQHTNQSRVGNEVLSEVVDVVTLDGGREI